MFNFTSNHFQQKINFKILLLWVSLFISTSLNARIELARQGTQKIDFNQEGFNVEQFFTSLLDATPEYLGCLAWQPEFFAILASRGMMNFWITSLASCDAQIRRNILFVAGMTWMLGDLKTFRQFISDRPQDLLWLEEEFCQKYRTSFFLTLCVGKQIGMNELFVYHAKQVVEIWEKIYLACDQDDLFFWIDNMRSKIRNWACLYPEPMSGILSQPEINWELLEQYL